MAFGVPMITFEPALSLVLHKLPLLRVPTLADAAARRMVVAPATTAQTLPAIALPGQLERVSGYIFSSEAEQRALLAGGRVEHHPTVAYELNDAILVDGCIHAGRAIRRLHPRSGRLPAFEVQEELDRAALYNSWNGIRYFGMWLAEDVPTYLLAEQHGEPLTLDVPLSGHQRDYERLLGMRPRRSSSVRVRKLFVYDDFSHHAEKRERVRRIRHRLLGDRSVRSHAGVFLLRGSAGDHRLLVNEPEIAEWMAEQRGLVVLDPMKASTEQIIEACAGARMVMGVEGSALMHAMPLLDDHATVFVLQPPNRFCCVYKNHADRDGHRFAFVVGRREGDSFRVDLDEVRRTLDLVDAAVRS